MNRDVPRRSLAHKLPVLLVLLVIFMGLLAACGGAGTTTTAPAPAAPTTAPAAAKPAAPTTAPAAPAAAAKPTDAALPKGAAGKLTVIHRTEYFSTLQDRFKEAMTDFAKQQNAQLDISTANPEMFGDFLAKMQAAVQAGVPPDLAYHTLSIPQMHSLDIVEDVTDVVEEAIKLYGEVVPVAAARNAKINGRWYAIPYQSNVGSWFVRKDLIEAAGIDMKTLDTLDGRREAALKISDPSKEIWGWGLTINKSGDGHGWIMDVIHAFGGSISDASGKKVTFNSPQTVQAVKWLQETYTSEKYKKMLPPGIESWTDTSNNEAYLAGKIGMTQNAFSVYAQLKRDKNPVLEKTAVMRKPQALDGKVYEAGANGWITIFKGTKNKDLAKKAALHMMKPEVLMPMAKESGGLFMPAYKNLWTDDLMKVDANFARLKDIMFNPTDYTGRSWPAAPSPLHDAVDGEAITSQMMVDVISGKMTPEQAVKAAHDKIVRIWEEGGIKQ